SLRLGVTVEFARSIEQRLDVLGAIEPYRSRLLRLQSPPAALGRVRADQPVLDGDLKNLPEAGDRLVDRRDRQRATWPPVFAPALVHALVGQRLAVGCCGLDRLGFCHLRPAVA